MSNAIMVIHPSGGVAATICAPRDWTVFRLKQAIEEATGVPREAQSLLVQDASMRDIHLLSEFLGVNTSEVTLVCNFLETEQWRKVLQNRQRCEEIFKYVQQGRYSAPSLLRVVAHHLWPLGPLGDADMWGNRDFVQRAMEQEVSLLALAEPQLTKDRNFMLRLIKKFGRAMKFADAELQEDRDFALEAIRLNFFALQSLSPLLREDPQFMQKAQDVCPMAKNFSPQLNPNNENVDVTFSLR